MLVYSFFKTLVGKEIVVELKNGALRLASQQHTVP
jgi:small nuclear ribonucleoprotein (snRNP)-like protein